MRRMTRRRRRMKRRTRRRTPSRRAGAEGFLVVLNLPCLFSGRVKAHSGELVYKAMSANLRAGLL